MGATDKSVLLAQWRHDSKTYRMVSVGTWSRGFEDELVVEREDSDTLGGSRWVEVDRWRPGGIDGARDIRSVLAAGVKAAMSPPATRPASSAPVVTTPMYPARVASATPSTDDDVNPMSRIGHGRGDD
jgi:hypothetical protein